MKKSFIFLLSLLLLSGCTSQGSTSETSSTSSITSQTTSTPTTQTSESSASNTSTSVPVKHEWPANMRDYCKTIVNLELPYISAFNSFACGDVKGSTKPYFSPYVEGATKDYSNEYKGLLESSGFKFEGTETSEGKTDYIYSKGDIFVQYSYYSNQGKKWFDVYAFNDKDPGEISGYKTNIEYSAFPKGYNTTTITAGSLSLKLTDAGKQNNTIQLSKNTGKIVITGDSFSELALDFTQYAYSCFVKAGSSSSNSEIIFNNAGVFSFGKSCSYIEIFTNEMNKQTNFLSINLK